MVVQSEVKQVECVTAVEEVESRLNMLSVFITVLTSPTAVFVLK